MASGYTLSTVGHTSTDALVYTSAVPDHCRPAADWTTKAQLGESPQGWPSAGPTPR